MLVVCSQKTHLFCLLLFFFFSFCSALACFTATHLSVGRNGESWAFSAASWADLVSALVPYSQVLCTRLFISFCCWHLLWTLNGSGSRDSEKSKENDTSLDSAEENGKNSPGSQQNSSQRASRAASDADAEDEERQKFDKYLRLRTRFIRSVFLLFPSYLLFSIKSIIFLSILQDLGRSPALLAASLGKDQNLIAKIRIVPNAQNFWVCIFPLPWLLQITIAHVWVLVLVAQTYIPLPCFCCF